MRNLKTSTKALLMAAIFAMPSQLPAGELPEGNEPYAIFHRAIASGQLAGPPIDGKPRPFDNGQAGNLKLIGASIVVQGISGGKETVKTIEYTYGQLKFPVIGPRSLDPKPTSVGRIIFALPLPSTSACMTSSGEPILAVGQEYNYHIQWCDNSTPSGPPDDSAKKNYYYMFANGDYQLVLTMEYDCDLPADAAAMPPPVLAGAC